ncbi:kinase-like protein, partial [Coemansia reversa NRRL 1564]
IDNFNIKRKLGSGTYGSVFKAKHISTNRKVALKFVKYNQSATKSARKHNERIEREIKLQSLLHHPNIARLYDVIQLPDQAGMVLEYVKGCDLLEYVSNYGRLREDEACRIFRQIVSAVDYMHQNCIVHRDLKLGNIMLDRSGQVRIIDFGFADTFEWGKQHNTFCGSPSYASPEIVCSVKYTGPEIDIWSMGVVLYYMLTGLLPFDGKSRDVVYAKIISGVFPMPTFVSAEAQHLLLQMLAVNPNLRIPMAGIIEHPWTNK